MLMILSNTNPAIVFVNPALGTRRYTDEDRLRSYLSLGTLASALMDKDFLKRFARRLGKVELIFDSINDYPAFDIHVLNLSLKPVRHSVREYCIEYLKQLDRKPLMVCMTATSAHLDEAEEIARAAELTVPSALRIIGGPHASAAAKEYLEKSDFQVACIGEGVETLSEIALRISEAKSFDLSMIEGIAFKREDSRVHLNSRRKHLFELDDYPFPSVSLDLFRNPAAEPEENAGQLIYILSGYGCPHDCIFCAQRRIHGRSIRERSADNIFEEIRSLHGRGFRKFAFVQETFLNRRKRVDAFCRLIEASGLRIEWTAEARADQLDYGQLEKMQKSGLHFIQIGVESGDPALLKSIGKGIDLERIIRIQEWCRRLKIHTAVYLLVGLPGQDWQSVLRSALFIMDHPPYNRITRHASVSIAIPYPGTQMWQVQTVRLMPTEALKHSWPQRNPEVVANDAGEFVGQNFTETDELTADEILEAWLYLDDFCHFLLHSMDPDLTAPSGQLKSREYADRMLYMIERRVIRDLIIRAQSPLSADDRKTAYSELVRSDQDIEKHFKDVTVATEDYYDIFARFLAAVKFENGFAAMRQLSVANRIVWMKICTLVWDLKGKAINKFRFNRDARGTGVELENHLQTLDKSVINKYLVQTDAGIASGSFTEITQDKQEIFAFGFRFSIFRDSTIEIES